MHILFSDWYRLAALNFDVEQLKLRWEGVEKTVKSLDRHSVFEIVRLFYHKAPKDKEYVSKFCNTFHEIDQSFPMLNNDLELSILAGASIAHCIESNPQHPTNIGLATVCANYLRRNINTRSQEEIVDITRKYLTQQSIHLRERTALNGINVDTKLDELKTALKNAFDAAHVIPLIDKITEAISSSVSMTNAAMKLLSKALLAQEEETNMLWWLYGEYSNDLKRPLRKIDKAALALLAPKELADLTKIIPGPISVEAFLEKAIGYGKGKKVTKISLKDAINSSPFEWKEAWIDGKDTDEVLDLCPVFYAMKKSVESGDDSSWIASLEKNTGIKADSLLPPVELALQAYEERLLIENIQE